MTNKEPWEAWSPAKVSSFQEDFLAWYEREKRNYLGERIQMRIVFGFLKLCYNKLA